MGYGIATRKTVARAQGLPVARSVRFVHPLKGRRTTWGRKDTRHVHQAESPRQSGLFSGFLPGVMEMLGIRRKGKEYNGDGRTTP